MSESRHRDRAINRREVIAILASICGLTPTLEAQTAKQTIRDLCAGRDAKGIDISVECGEPRNIPQKQWLVFRLDDIAGIKVSNGGKERFVTADEMWQSINAV